MFSVLNHISSWSTLKFLNAIQWDKYIYYIILRGIILGLSIFSVLSMQIFKSPARFDTWARPMNLL